MLDLEGEGNWEGWEEVTSKMCIHKRKKTVLCGECGCREVTKLEWFVGKANWDVVRMEVSFPPRTCMPISFLFTPTVACGSHPQLHTLSQSSYPQTTPVIFQPLLPTTTFTTRNDSFPFMYIWFATLLPSLPPFITIRNHPKMF